MDLLRKEMERKKKALSDSRQIDSSRIGSCRTGAGRYHKAGELRRFQEERDESERCKRHSNETEIVNKKRPRLMVERGQSPSEKVGESLEAAAETSSKESSLFTSNTETVASFQSNSKVGLLQLSPTDVTKRLRMMGLPVRLFGERTLRQGVDLVDDRARFQRLKEALEAHKESIASLLEKDEFRLGSGHGIRNPFLEKDETGAGGLITTTSFHKREDKGAHEVEVTEKETEEEASDPHKRVYKYFKGLLREWEDDLEKRTDDLKRTVGGRNETKTLKQCKDYIKPLFKLCKNRRLEESLLNNILKIVDDCQAGEFVRAHDTYMDVAIGRAPWPIGVTQVGIHSRTGRAKIESQNVAHVMNSELQRKYLTSIKRLMTFAQTKRTDILHSKKVLN